MQRTYECRIIVGPRREISANMPNEEETHSTEKIISDRPPKKRERGRPAHIEPSVVVGSADIYCLWFKQYWSKLGPRFLAARSAEDIKQAIAEHAPGIIGNLAPYLELILRILRDPRFPAVRSESQIHFLADSLGGQGLVKPRRSREICIQERSRVRHVIVRREYYIECSCGYQGPALDGACRECGTGELSSALMLENDH
jgi:hypothetical protein